jgi:outer membrane protein assembly factor BamB
MSVQYIFILAALLILACHKPERVDPIFDPSITDSDTSLVWFTDLEPDRVTYITTDPMEFDQGLIWGVFDFSPPESMRFHCLDKSSGAIKWTSERIFNISAIKRGQAPSGDYFIVNFDTMVYSMDVNTGAVHWSYWLPEPSLFAPRITAIGEHVYFSLLEDKDKTINHVVRTHGDRLSWDTVFTYHGQPGWLPYLEPPELWVRPDGDSILFMQDRTSDTSKLNYRVNMIAYNLSQRKIEWESIDISPSQNSAIYSPKIEGNNLILGLQYHVVNLDINTGEILWMVEVGDARDHILSCEILAKDGTVFVNPQYNHMLAIDIESGMTNWEYFNGEHVGRSGQHLDYYDGRVIKDAGEHFDEIVGLRPKNGSIAWTYKSKKPNSEFGYSKFIIHEDEKLLFVQNLIGIICIQLP